MGWFKDVVSELTGDSTSKVSKAGHDFRDDSGARAGNDKSAFESAPDWAEPKGSSGVDRFPEGKGPKG